LPELAPYPGQADYALRLVRVRRRRSATVAASATGAFVLAVLVGSRGDALALLK
jgi:hypothetical protein